MDAGRMRRHDPRLLLLAAYSMVTGLATEVEVLRAFGEEPSLASLVRRRDELLTLLRSALVSLPVGGVSAWWRTASGARGARGPGARARR